MLKIFNTFEKQLNGIIMKNLKWYLKRSSFNGLDDLYILQEVDDKPITSFCDLTPNQANELQVNLRLLVDSHNKSLQD